MVMSLWPRFLAHPVVHMQWKVFQCVYAQIVSDNNSQRMTDIA